MYILYTVDKEKALREAAKRKGGKDVRTYINTLRVCRDLHRNDRMQKGEDPKNRREKDTGAGRFRL